MLSILLVSCGSSGPTVKDDRKKLASYETYAFMPNKDTILDKAYDNELIHELIIESVNDNLESRGYSLNRRQPDVLVFIHPMFDEKVTINADPVYNNYSYYRPDYYIGPYYKDIIYDNYFTIQRIDGPRVKQVPYREKSIVIDFIDRRKNEILWRGTSNEEIGSKRLKREIRDYVDDLFKEFPK